MAPLEVIIDPDENPPYIWYTFEQARVVLARMKILEQRGGAEVKFLTVDFHWRKKGVARHAIELLKQRYSSIFAPDVRFEAQGFWERMGFTRLALTDDWQWERSDAR